MAASDRTIRGTVSTESRLGLQSHRATFLLHLYQPENAHVDGGSWDGGQGLFSALWLGSMVLQAEHQDKRVAVAVVRGR